LVPTTLDQNCKLFERKLKSKTYRQQQPLD